MALLWKELRECSLYAALALLAQIHYLGAAMNMPLIPLLSSERGQEIPFIPLPGSDREQTFTIVAVIAAIVLALQQTLWESWRQTTLFLLHRPMSRDSIFKVKMAAGLSLLLAVTVFPLLVYSLWAATPGTHASPFFWGATEPWWRSVGIAVAAYLGAFLIGVRQARWIGSRLLPLFAAIVMAVGLRQAPVSSFLAFPALAVLFAGLTLSIVETTRTREFP